MTSGSGPGKVIGGVTIGDRAEVGANGVVINDVPADTIAVGIPATRHVPKTPLIPRPGRLAVTGKRLRCPGHRRAGPPAVPEEVTCNLLGETTPARSMSYRTIAFTLTTSSGAVVQCRHCGLGYLNPRPTHEEVARYYPKHYFAHRGLLQDRYRREAAYLAARPGRVLDIGAARGDFLATLRDWDGRLKGSSRSIRRRTHTTSRSIESAFRKNPTSRRIIRRDHRLGRVRASS